MDIGLAVLLGITFFAAFVNGALGYGFSSLTVPVALLFHTSRILNPALVLVEVFINMYVLFINRGSVRAVWKRVSDPGRPLARRRARQLRARLDSSRLAQVRHLRVPAAADPGA